MPGTFARTNYGYAPTVARLLMTRYGTIPAGMERPSPDSLDRLLRAARQRVLTDQAYTCELDSRITERGTGQCPEIEGNPNRVSPFA
jgi:hypothetical protein